MQKWSPDGVRLERTGWRDESISKRHRLWGFDCPMVNIDFMAVEYNLGLPVALVEYKHYRARLPDLQHPSYRAQIRLADGYNEGPLPCMVVFYWPEVWAFRVLPMNMAAGRFFSEMQMLPEREFVRRLYRLRERATAGELNMRLNTALPPAQRRLAV